MKRLLLRLWPTKRTTPGKEIAVPWSDLDVVNAGVDSLFSKFVTSPRGLSKNEAARRLKVFGPNEPAKKKRRGPLTLLLSKFANPLIIVLLVIGSFSFIIGEKFSVVLIGLMILMSVSIAFVQEHRSGREVEKLIDLVKTMATVIRDGRPKEVSIKEIVPGDVVSLSAGDIIPADVRLLQCKDLFVNQAALTGESFPAEKCVGPTHLAGHEAFGAANMAYMGTSVVSGSASGLVIKTGSATQFGEVAGQLSEAPTETSFDRGIQGFSWLMIKSMMAMVVFIFFVIFLTKGTFIEALLFSLAVAVGLTPEMLPTIVAVNLTKGAIAMSKKKVIVKHLNSIQNFGAMDILCTDKTGTLTMDQVVLIKHCDVTGKEDEDVLRHAYLNSFYETGLKNLMDRAVLTHDKLVVGQYKKIDEIPFDFQRRIMSVVVNYEGGRHRLIAKGAPEEIFKRCDRYEIGGSAANIDELHLPGLKAEVDKLNSEGFRVLAIAYKDEPDSQTIFTKNDESGLILKGYVAFLDPPKPSAIEAVRSLKELGVQVKVLSGDNAIVTRKICNEVGLDGAEPVTGDLIDILSDDQLADLAEKTSVFARLSPMQKERVIKMLQGRKHVVGYLGDGINDAASLKVADVGISVNNAVDIAKESAELILLEKNLMVLRDGVIEGRRIFGNIIKYVRMGSSSNFGNMLSLTGASLFLPFVPMAPMQILLNNFLYDISQVSIPTDNVDEEYVRKPRPWNIASIRRFMVLMGPISSIFDFATFGVALFIFHAPIGLFRTFWFMESLWSQTLVIHVIRTAKRPIIESRSSRLLLATSVLICLTGLIIPLTPLAGPLGFVRPPLRWYPVLVVLVGGYLALTQILKTRFIRKYGYD
jgi:Mg2+-importing ATPase